MFSFPHSSLLASHRDQEIEATLHCVMAVQEAVPVEDSPHLRRIFGPDILGRLPKTGDERCRRTALHLIGASFASSNSVKYSPHTGSYASWFTTQPTQAAGAMTQSPLMAAITYVVSALTDPALCLFAANALRDLCDTNRTALAPHISAFGELHASLTGVPVRLNSPICANSSLTMIFLQDTEKAKILESIASVIQALPPTEGIPPVEVQ